MSKYIVSGSTIRVVNEHDICIFDKIPADVYSIAKNMSGFFLEKRDKFKLPKNLFGDIYKHGSRIISTFNHRPHGLGVLLSGIKGSGKSLLGKYVSSELLKQDVPTIVLPFSNINVETCEFIATICSPCVIFIDEVDKIEYEEQNFLLSLMDGTSTNKKMFILTANETYRISSWLLNRPGRIFYHIKHNNLSDETIRECCNKHLKNKAYIDDIFAIKQEVEDFSFDFLLNLIEESNRYKESPLAFIDIFNASSEGSSYYAVELFNGKRKVPTKDKIIEANIMQHSCYVYPKGERERNYDCEWCNNEISEKKNGKVIYKRDDYTLVLTRMENPLKKMSSLVF